MPSYTATADEEPVSSVYFVKPGYYKVKVINAVEKVSSNNNEMIKLDVVVILPDGSEGPEIWDYLVFAAKAKPRRHIDDFLASIGRPTVPGESVSVSAEDIIGAVGYALVGEKPGTTNPDHKFNTIEEWLFGAKKERYEKEQSESKHIVAKGNGYQPQPDETDDIPF